MSLAIVVPTYRSGAAAPTTWSDLRVCLTALTEYAPGVEVLVAWDGPCAPDRLPENPMVRLLERPKGLTSPQAHHWATQQTDATTFLGVSDDVVIQPDTVVTLLEDAQTLLSAGYRPGYLAARSNFAPGPQNVRNPNGGTWGGTVTGFDSEAKVLLAERVSPFCALMTREVSDIAGAPDVEWYSDDLACFDLAARGFTNWVSRAYVHHVGMRSSADGVAAGARLNEEALAWVREHRPDFWQHLLERAQRHAPAQAGPHGTRAARRQAARASR